MYEIYEKLKDSKGVTDYQVSKETGISRSAFTEWKKGRYSFKADKLKKIADYFKVSIDYLMTGKDDEKESTSGKKYYFDDDTAEKAQTLFVSSDMRVLFDAAQGSKPENLQLAADLLKRLKESNPDA